MAILLVNGRIHLDSKAYNSNLLSILPSILHVTSNDSRVIQIEMSSSQGIQTKVLRAFIENKKVYEATQNVCGEGE